MNVSISVSFEPTLVDKAYVYRFLRDQTYWGRSLTVEAFERSLRHSAVVAGLYDSDQGNRQVGFARVVSDLATFAYLTDVFIDEQYRGLGLSRLLLQAVFDHSDLQGLRRFLLVTQDAGGLYEKFGFQPLWDAEHWRQKFCE